MSDTKLNTVKEKIIKYLEKGCLTTAELHQRLNTTSKAYLETNLWQLKRFNLIVRINDKWCLGTEEDHLTVTPNLPLPSTPDNLITVAQIRPLPEQLLSPLIDWEAVQKDAIKGLKLWAIYLYFSGQKNRGIPHKVDINKDQGSEEMRNIMAEYLLPGDTEE